MISTLLLAAIPAIVPLPRSIEPAPQGFVLPASVRIRAGAREAGPAQFLAGFLRARGITVRIAPAGAADIALDTAARDAQLGTEGYRLAVTGSGVTLSANAPAGIFYGIQTFEQIVPRDRRTPLPGLTIADWPALRWRGIHLDVSRHFFPVSVVERYIDVAAHYKLNTFHWHLTDDQGWRIQIRRYPKLTTIGSCRAGTEMNGDATTIDSKRYCGFYTQQQIAEVVAYAARRYVTIVPEIEMPGHSTAALAAYPQLACGPGPFRVRETWGVSTDIYCPTPYTFSFLENVLSDVLQLFPGRYVHVGGDEVPKDEWHASPAVATLMKREHLKTYDAVQGYFDRRIEQFLESRGRRMVGWDEILDGGVSRGATVMSWRGEAGGIRAARRGNDVVMSPDGPLYFDAYQGDPNDEPQAIGNLSTPQMVYAYDPVPAVLSASQASHVLGVQANLWTEYVDTPSYLFYMLLPRELALSEIAWTPTRMKDWTSFEARSGAQFAWLAANGYNFRIPNPSFALDAAAVSFANVAPSIRTVQAYTGGSSATVTIADPLAGGVIRYTLDGSVPTSRSRLYAGPLIIAVPPRRELTITAAVFIGSRSSTPSALTLQQR